MKVWQQGILAVLVAVAAGCDTGTGPNSLYKFQPATGCTACHSSATSSSLDPLVTNGSGTAGKHVRHVQVRNIPCERCHYGYYPAEIHMNGTFDTANPALTLVRFDSTNSTATWTGDTGPGTGTCASVACHGGASLDWYAAAPACSACHSFPQGSRRPVTGTSGDFASNPSISSHHISGASDPTPEQCQVCHEMSQHMSGTVRLKEADTGAAIVYSASSPSALEPFCLSCHDAGGALVTFNTVSGGTPASPFNDGSVMGVAPNRASAEIKDSWNKAYGHRQKGLTCMGSGAPPNSGCHGNGHGAPFAGILARRLALPNPNGSQYTPLDEVDYDLCFTCHANYPRVTKEAILGVKQGGNYDIPGNPIPYYLSGIQTLFRDRNSNLQTRFYEDPVFFSAAYENLHFYHLQIGPGAWNYRDSIPSSVGCLACHSVHGSNTQWGWVHDSLLFSHFTGSGTEQYGMIGAALNSLGNYPTSCAFNCHPFFGTTHSWFEPSGE